MDSLKCILMHQDNPVCCLTVDSSSGAILRVSKPLNADLLPPGGNRDAQHLRTWWLRRAVPVSQGNIRILLEKAGYTTTQNYLVKNLGLSLTDHYWIRPLDLELCWKHVNLFSNDFRDPIGNQLLDTGTDSALGGLPTYAFSPGSSLQGDLKKKWIISEGTRYLIKGNHGSNSQESLNETVASLLHRKQGSQPYVEYQPILLPKEHQLGCKSACFTSDRLEFLSAYDVIESVKRDNSMSLYEHFIHVCALHGLSESITRPFLEYQILTDFVLTNTDRHLRNFGILRDTETLNYMYMAPIFDSGNSMFWKTPMLPAYDALTDIEVNSFRTKETLLLDYVHGSHQVNAALLPTIDELRELYAADPLIPVVDTILLGYQKKINLLEKKKLL